MVGVCVRKRQTDRERERESERGNDWNRATVVYVLYFANVLSWWKLQ